MFSHHSSLNINLSTLSGVRILLAVAAFIFCLTAAQMGTAQTRAKPAEKAATILGGGTITVNTNLDNETDGCGVNQCTLREAVDQANTAGGFDAIIFDAVFFATPQTIVLTGGELVITDNTGISGPGADRLTVSGNNAGRVFSATSVSGSITITGMTLTGGNGVGTILTGNGGAIYADGTGLALSAVVITGNLIDATSKGGGVYFATGSNFIDRSTFSNNNAGDNGGAICNSAGSSVAVTNSTISGNNSDNSGGGLSNSGNLSLRGVTITLNTAGAGGGISHDAGVLDLGGSIVAGNTGGSADDFMTSVAPVSSGYNLVGDNAFTGTSFPAGEPNANNDIAGTSATPQDPMLGPLAMNGGPTPTHAFSSIFSPAIDQGSSFGALVDQTGSFRTQDDPVIANAAGGDSTDIGAYEWQFAPTNAFVTVSGRVLTPAGQGINNARVTLADPEGNSVTVITNPLGYYRFDSVASGQGYIGTVTAKGYTFSSRVVTVTDTLNDVDFVSEP